MRIRGVHIVFAVLAVIALFVVFAAMRFRGETTPEQAATGQVPPVTKSSDLVPKIEVETTHFDMGEIGNEGPSKARMKIWNRGKAPLKITDIRTTCACTQGKAQQTEAGIAPGAESTIEITVDPYHIPGFRSHKTLTIMSNDPRKAMLEVDVTAHVKPEFELTPDEVDFGEFKKGESPKVILLARQLEEAPLVISKVEELSGGKSTSAHDSLLCSVEKRPEADWKAPGKAEYLISLQLSPTASPGPFAIKFGINTNVKRLPSLWCLAKGKIVACYRVDTASPKEDTAGKDSPDIRVKKDEASPEDAPTHITVLTLSQGGAASAPGQIGGTLAVTADRPIELADVQMEGDVFHAAARKGETPGKAYLEVTALPGAPAGIVTEAVRFTVVAGDARYEERVPVRALLR